MRLAPRFLLHVRTDKRYFLVCCFCTPWSIPNTKITIRFEQDPLFVEAEYRTRFIYIASDRTPTLIFISQILNSLTFENLQTLLSEICCESFGCIFMIC